MVDAAVNLESTINSGLGGKRDLAILLAGVPEEVRGHFDVLVDLECKLAEPNCEDLLLLTRQISHAVLAVAEEVQSWWNNETEPARAERASGSRSRGHVQPAAPTQQSSHTHTSATSYLLCHSLSILLVGILRADAVQQRSDKHYPPLFTVGALANCLTLPRCSTARGKSDGLCSCRASAHTAAT